MIQPYVLLKVSQSVHMVTLFIRCYTYFVSPWLCQGKFRQRNSFISVIIRTFCSSWQTSSNSIPFSRRFMHFPIKLLCILSCMFEETSAVDHKVSQHADFYQVSFPCTLLTQRSSLDYNQRISVYEVSSSMYLGVQENSNICFMFTFELKYFLNLKSLSCSKS